MREREALGVMDGPAPTTKPSNGIYLSRGAVFLISLAVLAGLVATALLAYIAAPSCSANFPFSAPLQPRPPIPNIRLPRSVVPDTYRLALIPFLTEGNFTFNGHVVITVNVTMPTNNITLHTKELKILDTNLSRSDADVIGDFSEGQPVQISKTMNDDERDFFIIFLRDTLEPGQYKISIKFIGILNDALQGFYRSSYMVGNKTRWIATSQFQSTDARRAFPCFDEPALKAKFTISIGRPKNMSSVSNMPKVGRSTPVDDVPGYEWDHFGQSVPMSTYLVAFTVSDFEQLSDGTFTVWARAEALQQARFSLEIGPRILRYFEQYFQIPFPLPKIDMIALPDFAAGAMENWGLITFRENLMLFQQGVSTNRHKERVGTVVSHELAHQWFGNLVTPSWWSDLWLNEGFASYIETIGVDMVEPTWRSADQFVVHDLQSVLELDAFNSSHPVFASVSHPNEIDEIFDSISYGKGASIIRMMDHFLTTPVFKRGLTNYLRSKAYQSATQDDLWKVLTEQAISENALDKGFNVKTIMDTWTLKTGFPMVTIIRNYEDGTAFVKQERFQYNMSRPNAGEWWVPLSYTTQAEKNFVTTKPSHWLKGESAITMTDLNAQPNHWVLFNIKETGFYRVNYDLRNWNLISTFLMDSTRFTQIGELNRAQIIDDALNLARAGVIGYPIALNLTRYLVQETSYLPWSSALSDFRYIRSMINKMPIYEKFKSYVLQLLSQLYDEIGFSDSPTADQLTVYKRVDIVQWACLLGHEDCVRNAVTQFQNWRSTPQPDKNNPISPNLKGTVYCTAIREGGQAEWEFAWERYQRAYVGSEKNLLISALGCTRETWLLSRYLYWAVTDNSGIRKQDAPSVFSAVSNNVVGQPLAFAFVRDQWVLLKQYFGSTLFSLNTIIRVTTGEINTEFDVKMLKEFAMAHIQELGNAATAVIQAVEQAEANVAWMKHNYHQIEEWLLNVPSKKYY